MEIPRLTEEDFKSLNVRLKDYFGSTEDKPNFRLVFSEDIYEKRWTDHTDEGFELLQPEVRLLPKYKQWIHHKYILERLTVLPSLEGSDLIENLSYEPIWTFENVKGEPLLPIWPAMEIVIEVVNNAMARKDYVKIYEDENANLSPEEQDEKLKGLVKELFGNETDIGDALAYREGIVVPANFVKSNSEENE